MTATSHDAGTKSTSTAGQPAPNAYDVEPPQTTTSDVAPLEWLADILWPDGNVALVPGDDATPAQGAHGRQWWASPSAHGAEILIPADLKAAQTAVRRYHDGFSLKKRARSWAAEVAMQIPQAATRMLSSALVVTEGGNDNRRADLLDELGRLVGEPELRVAISLARPKSNRKPVLQLISSTGRALGWAKIGWTEWTADLVGNEAMWLARDSSAPLVKPDLLHDVDISGHRVVVTSGVIGSRRPHPGSSLSPNIEVVSAIAAMGSTTESRVAQMPWWSSVADVLDMADETEASLIQAVADATDHVDFRAGAWHGDLTPWNTMTTVQAGKKVAQVIDWEFAADGVPLGFDICHFHTQVATELRGLSPAEALDHSARHSPGDLAKLGVEGHNRIFTWQLYLLELVRRTLALRKAGFPTEQVHQGQAALDRLARIHKVDAESDR